MSFMLKFLCRNLWQVKMSELRKLFGKKVQFVRKARGMTQIELGEKVGITQRQLTRIECGTSFPSSELLERICLCLDVPVKQLFDFSLAVNEVKATGTYGGGNYTYNAIKFGDVFKLELADKNETSQKILKGNNKEIACDAIDTKFLQIAKKSNKPVSVAYQDGGETFRVTIYFPDGSTKNLKDIENQNKDEKKKNLLELIENISLDSQKIKFIELAVEALTDNDKLCKLKNQVDGMCIRL